MWKALVVAVSVVVINFGLTVFERGDAFGDFIPFIQSLEMGRISDFDFFLFMSVILLRIVALYYGATWGNIRNSIQSFFTGHCIGDWISMVMSGFLMQVLVWPILVGVFQEPIATLHNSPAAIRQVFLLMLPVLWLISVSKLTRMNVSHSGGKSHYPTQPFNNSQIP